MPSKGVRWRKGGRWPGKFKRSQREVEGGREAKRMREVEGGNEAERGREGREGCREGGKLRDVGRLGPRKREGG